MFLHFSQKLLLVRATGIGNFDISTHGFSVVVVFVGVEGHILVLAGLKAELVAGGRQRAGGAGRLYGHRRNRRVRECRIETEVAHFW